MIMHKGIHAVLVLLLAAAGMEVTMAAKGIRDRVKNSKLKTEKEALSLDNLCKTTLYPDACMKTLGSSNINLTDSGQVLKVSFEVAKAALLDGISKFATIKQARVDPKAAQGLEICNETMAYALNDMERSVNAVGKLNNAREINKFIEDLKVWVGGSLTYQQVCYDAFEGAKDTEIGMKIRTFFNTSQELTSNALALMDNAQHLQGLSAGGTSRHLLKKSNKAGNNGLMPSVGVNRGRR